MRHVHRHVSGTVKGLAVGIRVRTRVGACGGRVVEGGEVVADGGHRVVGVLVPAGGGAFGRGELADEFVWGLEEVGGGDCGEGVLVERGGG